MALLFEDSTEVTTTPPLGRVEACKPVDGIDDRLGFGLSCPDACNEVADLSEHDLSQLKLGNDAGATHHLQLQHVTK